MWQEISFNETQWWWGTMPFVSNPRHAKPQTSSILRSLWAPAALVALIGAALRVGVLAAVAAAQDDKLWGLLNKWDAKHYVEIARGGYFGADISTDGPVHETTMAFFPGFPFLVRGLSSIFGTDEAGTAIALNVLFSIALAAGVMALAARMGMGKWAQVLSAVVVTSAPMSIVFSMPYTEALFGALAIWAVVALVEERWWAAAALIFVAGLVRLTAVDLVAVFAFMVLLRARKNWRAWAAVVFSVVPLVGYLWWSSSHLKEVGGYFGIQKEHWNSSFDGGKATVIWLWETLSGATNGGYLLSAGVMIAAPVFLVLAWRRLPLAAWLFSAVLMANVLLSDGIMHSRPRLLLPAVIVLLPWVRKGTSASVAVGAWALFGAWFSAYMLGVFEWAI